MKNAPAASKLSVVKVHFDTGSLHRPLDNKVQLRVELEAETFLGASRLEWVTMPRSGMICWVMCVDELVEEIKRRRK